MLSSYAGKANEACEQYLAALSDAKPPHFPGLGRHMPRPWHMDDVLLLLFLVQQMHSTIPYASNAL